MSIYHFYYCDECIADFGVEAHEDLDHSKIVCPLCQSDKHLLMKRENVEVMG